MTDTISAVSERVARDVRPIAGTRSLAILPNGVDVDFWRVDPKPAHNGGLELISVMRLNPKKRALALVGIVKQIDAMRPGGERVRLRIVGDGPQRLVHCGRQLRPCAGGFHTPRALSVRA